MSDQLRTPPSSVQAEQAVIGGLLQNNDAFDRIGGLLTEHFYTAEHRAIFDVIVAMISAGKVADVITIHDAARAKAKRDDILVYLTELIAKTPSAVNIGRHAAIVRDRAIKRGIITATDELAEHAFTSPDDAVALLDMAGSKLEALALTKRQSEPVRASDDMAAHLRLLDDRESGAVRAISTGLPDIDEKLAGGLRPGELIVLAARPKMGKTGLAMQVARYVSVEHVALVCSMEMPRTQLHDRNLAALAFVPLRHLLVPSEMATGEWTKITTAVGAMESLNLFIDDQGGLRLIDVRMKARLVKRRHGLNVLVLDYLQLMEGEGESRNEQIAVITRGLKALAKELDITIILLSQLNRRLEERPNKRPQPSDLRDSGSIEQDADAVLFVYRDEVYNADTQDKGIAEVNVALNRQGPTGRLLLTFIDEQVRFETCTRPWTPPVPITAPRRARQFEED